MDRDVLLQDMKARLQTAFGERFRGLVLYGSEARGEATQESDIDLLVLLEGPVFLWDDLTTIINALYPLQLEVLRPIEAIPVDIGEYEAGDYSLYRSAKEEGIVV